MEYLAEHYRKQVEALEKRKAELVEELARLNEANIQNAGEIQKDLKARKDELSKSEQNRLSLKAADRSAKTKKLLFALSDEKHMIHHPDNARLKDSVIKVLADTMSDEYEKALSGYADTTDVRNAVKVLKTPR